VRIANEGRLKQSARGDTLLEKKSCKSPGGRLNRATSDQSPVLKQKSVSGIDTPIINSPKDKRCRKK